MVPVFLSPDQKIFKKARDIDAGDVYAFSVKPEEYIHDGALHRSNYVGHFNAKTVSFPTTITPELSWMIGFFHGDGHVSPKGLEISGNSSERSYLELWNQLSEKYFSVSGVVKKDSHNGNGIRLRINSVALSSWFSELKKSNDSIKIPDFIKYGSVDVRSAYLSGLLDSDGRVRNDGVIELATTIYKSYAIQILGLAESLGVIPKCTFYSAKSRRDSGVDAKDYYTIKICGNSNRKNFVDLATSSRKLDGYESSYSSPKDFSFPVKMFGSVKGFTQDQTVLLGTAIRMGLVEESTYAPIIITEVLK